MGEGDLLTVRFNDLTQTILAVEDRTGTAAASLWRQCVDMLAQHDQAGRMLLPQEDRAALVARLNDLRGELTEAQRIASVVELGSRLRSPALVEFFATDRSAVCVAALSRARLPDSMWPMLLSRLGPTARGVLRSRRDIGPETQRALEAFGTTDMVLGNGAAIVSNDVGAAEITDMGAEYLLTSVVVPEAAPEATAPEQSSDGTVRNTERSQIRQLVERIERFTSISRARTSPFTLNEAADTSITADEDIHLAADQVVVRTFPFETDAEGTLIWVGEASRTALIGLSIAQIGLPGETGPDGHVAGAFARRSSFQHGRLYIGEGLYEGEWRLSAVPFFDPASGRFQGYRGQARRPMVHEIPLKSTVQPPASVAQPSLDSVRQLIHELRTPLNAILGFAEIIEQQLYGPAGAHYREIAGNILSDARRLLAAFEDIDTAARASAAQDAAIESPASRSDVDIVTVVDGVAALFASDGVARLRITASADLPHAHVDPLQCERMIQHLVRTLMPLTQGEEMVQGALWLQPDGTGGKLILGLDRPARLKGLDEHELLDPGYGSDGDWPDAPLLGLGFSMRLVRSLALAQDCSLRIENERILLELPITKGSALADNESA